MPRRAVRLLLGVLVAVLLASCRVDATVELVIGPDGTGTLTVTAVADAEVVQQAPGLADDLRFDDAVAAGWSVDGPAATEDGGLRVVLTHPVTSAAEATNLLQQPRARRSRNGRGARGRRRRRRRDDRRWPATSC